MNLFLELAPGSGAGSRLALQPGLQRIKVAVGDRFRLIDENGATPEGVVVKRLDNHLIVVGLPDGIEIELSDFYARCGISSPCSLDLMPLDASVVSITPRSEPVRALTDGSFVLYPASYDPGPAASADAAAAGLSGEGFGRAIGSGWMVGGIALGAFAIGGLSGGGGGDGDGEQGKLPGSPGLESTPSQERG